MSNQWDELLENLQGKIVAIFGYPEDGLPHAEYLRKNGVKVIFGIREDRNEYQKAIDDGQDVRTPEEAARVAEIIQLW
jgi:ketol-acid reductoisomerase